MNDIIKMYQKIEMKPETCLAEKRVDYLFHYWLGRLGGESYYRGWLFYTELADWIRKKLKRKGYRLELNYCWYKMLYAALDTDEAAWNFFFKYIYKFIRKRGKKQTEKEKQDSQSKIKDVKTRFYMFEKRPGVAVGEKRLDYLIHNFAGIYAKEDDNLNSESYAKITQWIYDSLRDKGYKIELSRWWHKMIYQVTTDEDEAWELFFQIMHEYFDGDSKD